MIKFNQIKYSPAFFGSQKPVSSDKNKTSNPYGKIKKERIPHWVTLGGQLGPGLQLEYAQYQTDEARCGGNRHLRLPM